MITVVTNLDTLFDCSYLGQIEITEPDSLYFSSVESSDYNGYGVSCYDSSDGFINISIEGGVFTDDNNLCSDFDEDGVCDIDDVDIDGDGIDNVIDLCPYNSDLNCECHINDPEFTDTAMAIFNGWVASGIVPAGKIG